MLYQIKAYLKFLFRSTNQHGIHSPFIYQLVTKCFYDRSKYTQYADIKAYRKSLIRNKNKIIINDLGSGSKVFSSKERSINRIAKISGSSYKRAKLIYRLAHYFKPSSILELGTSLGIATHAMSKGNSKADVTTIEGASNCAEFARLQLKTFNINNVNVIVGDFANTINDLKQSHWDFVFFDGHHSKTATLNNFEALLSTAHNETLFIFDDIHWSKDMSEAWEIIKQHPKVTVTIDTFYWGFVFFRKEQVKEHFNIRLN
ncbi:methyltransferase [Flavobacteriales bacterium 34_180_T64]|nr:methyltransferase [Flavobacteriales bacterium 34_180_T64]